jgi:hypothetical protein
MKSKYGSIYVPLRRLHGNEMQNESQSVMLGPQINGSVSVGNTVSTFSGKNTS